MNRSMYGLVAGLLALGTTLPVMAADVPALIGWAQRVELGTLVSGVVSEVHVRPGQAVAKGDPLLSLDQRGFASQVGRRQAEYRHARAMLEEAEREDARAVELYDRTVLSDFERNQALIALEAARATAEGARAQLVAARLDLEHSVLSAPFDGVVLSVNAAPGQSVVSELQSQPLVTVANGRTLQARAEVDAEQASRLQPGQALNATLRGSSARATVDHVGLEPVENGGSTLRYPLLVDVPVGEGPAPRVGETLTLHLE
ncbi:MAG: efflux RND transporter periplasmic adaptor subunit [Chromatiaceae bacterium]|nr:efflux RND transporter periplasmic adaptor subunit [Gammaproteobacteria bacterium]MCP5303975.1 efflux RND transporter periplasmic adaptor subunit [Chromatiaceae bacterium]MCP5313702.1 efflux RND transporter periplasmic adaptor subunit [Chromatiaceae bacterium]